MFTVMKKFSECPTTSRSYHKPRNDKTLFAKQQHKLSCCYSACDRFILPVHVKPAPIKNIFIVMSLSVMKMIVLTC